MICVKLIWPNHRDFTSNNIWANRKKCKLNQKEQRKSEQRKNKNQNQEAVWTTATVTHMSRDSIDVWYWPNIIISPLISSAPSSGWRPILPTNNVLTDCHLTSSNRRTQPRCWLFKQKLKEKEKTKETKKKKEQRRKQENNKKRGRRERNGTRWWTFQNKMAFEKPPFDKRKAELTWRRSKHREKVNTRKRSKRMNQEKRKETIEMEEAIEETQERTRNCNLSIKNKVKEMIINHHTNGKKEVKS
jgi:hypothetical protein